MNIVGMHHHHTAVHLPGGRFLGAGCDTQGNQHHNCQQERSAFPEFHHSVPPFSMERFADRYGFIISYPRIPERRNFPALQKVLRFSSAMLSTARDGGNLNWGMLYWSQFKQNRRDFSWQPICSKAALWSPAAEPNVQIF